jgi:hypothetical protein
MQHTIWRLRGKIWQSFATDSAQCTLPLGQEKFASSMNFPLQIFIVELPALTSLLQLLRHSLVTKHIDSHSISALDSGFHFASVFWILALSCNFYANASALTVEQWTNHTHATLLAASCSAYLISLNMEEKCSPKWRLTSIILYGIISQTIAFSILFTDVRIKKKSRIYSPSV